MTRTLATILTIAALMVVPALMGLATDTAAANPNFGGREFQAQLQQDLGLWGPPQGSARPCPTVHGVPIPTTWGREWSTSDPWMRELDRTGLPPGNRRWELPETPDQKWAKQVNGYRAFLISHPFDGSRDWYQMHDHFMQYLEQNWYNYWYRLRYGHNPDNYDSNYFGWGYGREGW